MGKLKRGINGWLDRKNALVTSGGFNFDPVWGRIVSFGYNYLVDVHEPETLEVYSNDSKGKILIPYNYVKLKRGDIIFKFNGSEYMVGESKSVDFISKIENSIEVRNRIHKWLLENGFDELDNQGLWTYSKKGLNLEITIFYSSVLIDDGKVKLDVPLRGVTLIDRFMIVSCVGTMILIDTKVNEA